MQWFAFNPRKAFLHLGCHSNHLVGIGGPGAPHEFYFQRAQDLGNLVVEDDDLDGNVGDVVDVVDVVVIAGNLLIGFTHPAMLQGTSHDCCCWRFLESLLLLLLLLSLSLLVPSGLQS